MSISEQLECFSSAPADPARRCRIKCYAAGVGALGLLLVLLIGSVSITPDSAHHSAAQAGTDRHE